MTNILGKLFVSLLKKLDFYSLYMLKKFGYLKEIGWFKSFSDEASVDADGNFIPWLTYPAIAFLEKRIISNMSVFEYGSGGSTLWWASHVEKVVSVEHDKDWYQYISKIIPHNVDLHYSKLEYGGLYSKFINSYIDRFDIVVIDGRDRVNCIKNSLASLKHDGIIVLDDSDREEYAPGCEFLFSHGFKKIEFVGLSPIAVVKAETGIFYREDNCLWI